MKNFLDSFKQENIGAGYLYFYIHLITEIACFYCLSSILGNSILSWSIPFVYDAFAFVPQSLIGYFSDKYPKVNLGLVGIVLLIIGFLTYMFNVLPGTYTELIILCLGNCCIHVNGAEVTLRCSKGKLSHSAIFVGGGAFGVVLGKIMTKNILSIIFITFLMLSMIPFAILAEKYKDTRTKDLCKGFNYHNPKINTGLLIILAVFVVMVRGYMGYGIPTTWNKTVIQTVLLYFMMGTGKCLGGILCDAYGIKRVAQISVLLALPFLLFGDHIMIVSLLGIVMFSMTMSITLALLVSVLKNKPGLAFGLTTIGLFLGIAPIFFIKLTTYTAHAVVISVFTIICYFILSIIIRKDNGNERN